MLLICAYIAFTTQSARLERVAGANSVRVCRLICGAINFANDWICTIICVYLCHPYIVLLCVFDKAPRCWIYRWNEGWYMLCAPFSCMQSTENTLWGCFPTGARAIFRDDSTPHTRNMRISGASSHFAIRLRSANHTSRRLGVIREPNRRTVSARIANIA